ncbi:putative porin [Gracilimonas sp.]|uniref:putative porin n=1 Tax=Gracilimonas sp. TaxID=1974203 RepID=UPI00287198E5|nr:putative porin [Gracilimonas sp.]
MRIFIILHIALWLLPCLIFAQDADSLRTDSLRTELPLGGFEEQADTLAQEDQPEPGQVTPWKETHGLRAEAVTNDSLLRWQIWPNWGDLFAYRRDVISFRQGTIGRLDAFHINGFQPYEQDISLEGISLNNPITGLPNYNLVPHRKIGLATETLSGNYESDLQIRDYYLTKPRSYLNYDEAGGSYRNLEFLVSQNFTEQTNVEISYWDRRGGSYYPRSKVEGNQIVARAYHHLSERLLLRGLLVSNQLTNEEPFGYNIGDPAQFPFSEFNSTPLVSSAESEFNRRDIKLGLYHRKNEHESENAGIELFHTKNEYDLTFSGDTLSRYINSYGANLFKKIDWKGFNFEGELKATQHSSPNRSPVELTKWSEVDVGAALEYELFDEMTLFGSTKLSNRSDDKNGYDVTGGARLELLSRLGIEGSVSRTSHIPTIQSLYWQSSNYRGNESLENEESVSMLAKLDLRLTSSLTFGAKGRFKIASNSTHLTQDSTFTNSSDYEQLSATVFGKFENNLLEIESSGTVQDVSYSDVNAANADLNHLDRIVWIRNSAFVKGYVFDRAAYLKLGVKTLLSPFYYSARTFNTELGYWQGNSTYQELPPFFRLDGELSARVRGIMVVLRYENALDGFGQAGYFEAAGFPMPPRRLIVGIRAQFRN